LLSYNFVVGLGLIQTKLSSFQLGSQQAVVNSSGSARLVEGHSLAKIITDTSNQAQGDFMKLRTLAVLQLAALCLALVSSAFAANNAYLYVVHGIPGRDISDSLNPGLPVDILVDGECAVRGLTFGNTNGP